MRSEYYSLDIVYNDQHYDIPVTIDFKPGASKISAWVNGEKVTFQQDEHHDGLRPITGDRSLDPQLCHLIGAAIYHEYTLQSYPLYKK